MQYTYFSFDTEEKSRKTFQLPGAKPHYNPDRPGQVEHIALDLVLDLPNASFSGTCTITLTPVRAGITQFTLDAIALDIRSVLVDRVSQPYHYDGDRLHVQLLEPTGTEVVQIAIAYGVEHPQRGLYFIQPDEHYPEKPVQVWTQGEEEDSRYWFPCFDYPGQLATSEIRVRVPNSYVAVANGELIATEAIGEETIYHWLQNKVHPTYLMTLAVGDFAEIKDEWNGIAIAYYGEKGREADLQRTLGKTPRMVEFFSSKYGYTYAYSKYAQVCVADFIFGGMENTSTTLLTDRCLLDERAELDSTRSESLVAHELAHQWFGDLLVIKHWSHAWIKEGMASYAEVLWTEAEYGREDAAYYLLNEARSYLSEDRSRYRRPMVTNIYRKAIELYDRHLYEKGACVYHMIRAELGEELFDCAIQTFVRDNAHKTVETVDLLRAIETATGRNLAFLFDQYVFRGGHPDFKVAYTWDGEASLAKLTVTQTQAKPEAENESDRELFDLRVPVAFGYISETGSKPEQKGEANLRRHTFVLRINQKEQSFYFSLEKQPQFVSFDVGNDYLKTVKLEYPLQELEAQLKHDPDPVSRIYAAEAIAKKGGLEAAKILAEALKSDRFWGVRLEAAKQLGKVKLDRAATALANGLKDSDPRVRRATLEALSKFKTADTYAAVETIARDGDPSYYAEAAALRHLGSMVTGNLREKQSDAIALLQAVLETRAGWNEVVRGGAIAGLAQLKTSSQAAEIIARYTELGVPQPLRLAAIRALGTVSAGQEQTQVEVILERLEAIANETFFLTQVAVVNALKQMQVASAVEILRSLAEQSPDARVRRMADEAIETVQGKLGADKNLKKVQDDLETLKQENLNLKSRLAKLEAASKTD